MKDVNSSAPEKRRFPPMSTHPIYFLNYLLPLNKYIQKPTPSFAAAALEVRAKTGSKLTFPTGDRSKPHTEFGSRPPQVSKSSTTVARLRSYYTVAGYSTCHPLQPFDVQRSCPANNMLFLKSDATHLNWVCKWKVNIQKPA